MAHSKVVQSAMTRTVVMSLENSQNGYHRDFEKKYVFPGKPRRCDGRPFASTPDLAQNKICCIGTYTEYFVCYFIYIFIFLTHRKATEALLLRVRVSNYPDLLPEMPRYCCPLVM